MLARIPRFRAFLVAAAAWTPLAALAVASAACTRLPAPAMCSRACDDGFSCVSGECLRAGTVPDVEAVDKFGGYQARRLVVAPTEVVRLAPGDARGERPRIATLGRARDAGSILLFRFAVDLPPGEMVLAAHIVLDRAFSLEDPSPVVLRAARIVEPWDARTVSWGRAPRVESVRSPVTTVDDARSSVRLDVRSLVARWRRHAPEDQGIAIVSDRSSATGISFALADAGGTDDRAPLLPVRAQNDTPPTFHSVHSATEASEGADDGRAPRGPRLELYVKP